MDEARRRWFWWGNYFSSVVSKDVFGKMDHLIFRKLWAWAMRRHPNKSRYWVAEKYWLMNTPGWRFGDGQLNLYQMREIPIRRHIVVQQHRSPYDGDALYWNIRTGNHPAMPHSLARLLHHHKGVCPVCGLFFQPSDSLRLVRRFEGRTDDHPAQARLLHEHCLDSPHVRRVMTTHHFTEEPDEGKLSRPVLESSMGGDAHA